MLINGLDHQTLSAFEAGHMLQKLAVAGSALTAVVRTEVVIATELASSGRTLQGTPPRSASLLPLTSFPSTSRPIRLIPPLDSSRL